MKTEINAFSNIKSDILALAKAYNDSGNEGSASIPATDMYRLFYILRERWQGFSSHQTRVNLYPESMVSIDIRDVFAEPGNSDSVYMFLAWNVEEKDREYSYMTIRWYDGREEEPVACIRFGKLFSKRESSLEEILGKLEPVAA